MRRALDAVRRLSFQALVRMGRKWPVRERTAELQRPNAEMRFRIGHLGYLNEKGRAFAHLLDRKAVLEEILKRSRSAVGKGPAGL